MSKMIQIRNVPDELHRKLKIQAAEQSLSLSDYLLNELLLVADKPSIKELLEWTSAMPAVKLKTNPVNIIRESRDVL